MENRFLPIDTTKHASHGWKKYDNYGFAGQDSTAPLLLAELAAALPFYPMAFALRPGGGFNLVALLGLHAGENLFVDASGKWKVGYVPGRYRGYPFALLKADSSEAHRFALCFDLASNLYREKPDPTKGEERFYKDDKTMGTLLGQVLDFLKQTTSNRIITFHAIEALRKAGLLVPWTLPLKNPDPSRPMIGDLYCIDEKKMQALEGESLKEVHKTHGLSIAYAQLFSTARLGILPNLFALRRKTEQATAPSSMEALFAKDESFHF